MKTYYIETYGCQMNVADSELVAGLLKQSGYTPTNSEVDANAIFLNTCAIREHAEDKIHSRLGTLKNLKKERPEILIGILGCMAQHVKDDILYNKSYVDFVLGPDSYRHIPSLLKRQEYKRDSIVDTRLSKFEVYENLFPSRKEGVNAWVSIMRGCDKFCTFCIVPFTRGRERSRNLKSIIEEVEQAVDEGFLEITLLGQNVNSYESNKTRFPELLNSISEIKGVKRIRFTSPHPKDINDEMLFVMRDKSNICNSVHLPLQAGSDRILKKMNRTYTKSEFIHLAEHIRNVLPNCGLSTDIIAGFPSETDKDFEDTLDVMEQIIFDSAFTFKYSPRPGTKATEYSNHISEKVKDDRLQKLIKLQQSHTIKRNEKEISKVVKVLVEKNSKKSNQQWAGRTDANKWVIFPKKDTQIGDFVNVKIVDARGISLFGELDEKKEISSAII
ncbi:MAG: tRNA (N6-isopentenyl adenosine(37)-C2)-methylthiotransferase MiaB [Candidatus Marinimicrobia bacterium]|nr:tRNA (N6-isopentenyl adenosine(37)-C2)-methylthiotransferase MiaB [Candidatus Neomarinimicrobiota bacterium]|tara:strand:+ start:2124 stop:3455 length:1332 start_codon:yes stop_codon:yes gene_type:complete